MTQAPENQADETPIHGNHWIRRAIISALAIGILCCVIPWASLEKYVFLPVTYLRNFAIVWLIGVHCLVHRRARWLGFIGVIGAIAIVISSVVIYVLDGTAAPKYHTPVLHYLNTQFLAFMFSVAIVLLLLFPRLKGFRQIIQRATAISVMATLVSYWAYLSSSNELYHMVWIVYGCLGLSAYVGIFVTSYYMAVYHEPLKTYVPVRDAAERVKFECPRCMKMQALPLGRSACPDCGLVIQIEIEESPCVKCGYNLRGLPKNICPECGTAFGVQAATNPDSMNFATPTT